MTASAEHAMRVGLFPLHEDPLHPAAIAVEGEMIMSAWLHANIAVATSVRLKRLVFIRAPSVGLLVSNRRKISLRREGFADSSSQGRGTVQVTRVPPVDPGSTRQCPCSDPARVFMFCNPLPGT